MIEKVILWSFCGGNHMQRSRFDAGKAVRSLRDEVDTLFDRFVERPLGVIKGQVVPSVDISETDAEIHVAADLPGMDEKDMEVSVTGQTLTIRGQRKQEREETGKTCHVIERAYGSFSRSIQLPAAVKADQVQASYKKGVLKIVLPKKEILQAKRVEIKSEEE
jgi:HSP20 family protein